MGSRRSRSVRSTTWARTSTPRRCDGRCGTPPRCSASRVSCIAARIGGDEFCVLLAGSGGTIDKVLERLHDNVRVANDFGDRPFSLSISIGVASSTDGCRHGLGELIRLADEGMYMDKQARRVAR